MWLDGDNERGLWGVQWRSDNHADGKERHLVWDYGPTPLLFKTRRAAQKYINEHYDYIRSRPDLRVEPFGWKMPIPIKVRVAWEVQKRRM